jgi:heme/copper-type cytochrome/quinol oxidase subunit 2
MGEMTFFPDLGSVNQSDIIDLYHFMAKIVIYVVIFVLCALVYALGWFSIRKIILWIREEGVTMDMLMFLFKKEISINRDEKKVNILFGLNYDVSDYITLEMLWLAPPTSVLYAIAEPTAAVEYLSEPNIDPKVILKIMGNQWYWHYDLLFIKSATATEIVQEIIKEDISWLAIYEGEYDIIMNDMIYYQKSFDSVLVEGSRRLLVVDENIILPVGVPVKILITSSDVLHSWSLPGLGVKMDAVPGRISSIMIIIDRPGLYYGQCSELCGPMHGFMPIVVEAVNYENFCKYMEKYRLTEHRLIRRINEKP